MDDPRIPAIRSVLGADDHIDEPMPRIFETDGAMAVIIIRKPHTVVDGEAELDVTAHVSDMVPPQVIAALLHGVADTIAEVPDES